MRNLKPSLILASLGVIGLALMARGFVDSTGGQMAESASRFLTSLDDSQKAQATFGFDDPERLNWHFIPRPRKGLPVKAMTPAQRALAFGLLQTGLGGSGYLKATTIMSLEAILKDLEQGRGTGPRPRALLPDGLRHPLGLERQVGLAGRGPSPVA